MSNFRKKPVIIQAFQLTYEMAQGDSPCPVWFAEAVLKKDVKVFVTDKIHGSQYCQIKTLEGVMTANRNDYIIRGVQGEIYPCKPDIFEATYEAVGPVKNFELSFGQAIEAAKQGKRVARAGWNGSGMFAYIVPAASYPAQTGAAKAHFGENALVPYREYWALKTAQNDVAPWAPSGSDSLAEDWIVLD